ncbi:MAG TPA: efflux RND transporter permease subunit [Candidatus Dormibacteraeota bacterium]|nr:efflux RND transporter permease subunit [Candidatus Dormibacteraeota bacterium]
MIRELVALSLKFRVLVVGVAVVVMGLGAFQLRDAKVAALPEFSPTIVTVQAEAQGLSAAEVEQFVTTGLEQDLLNGVPWLDHMESTSAPGYVRVDLIFKQGTDSLKARQAVQERLTQSFALPAVGTPPVMLQPLSSTSRVMMVGLSAKDLSLTDLSVLARWKIKPRLMGVPGVADVSIWGQRDRQMQVQVDPDKLRAKGVSLDQVISTTGNSLFVSPLNFLEASTPGTGGFVDTSTQRLAIQHVLPVTTSKDLADVTIDDTNGHVLRLGDVASVITDHQPFLVGDAVLNSGPGLMLVVQKFPEASTQVVTRGIEDALAALRPGLSGVRVDTQVYQAQSYVDAAVRDLGITGLISLALLILVVGLLLYSWRLAVITMVSVLVSVMAAAYVLYLRATTFDLMLLGGLAMALSVVIGDAVTDLAEVRRRLHERRAAGEPLSIGSVIAEVMAGVRGPLLYGTLIALLAPVPLIFLDGVGGAFAQPAVLSYALSLAASTVVALAVVPALASLVLRGDTAAPRTSPVLRLAARVFDGTVARWVRRPRWAYASVAALLAVGLAVLPQLNTRAPLPAPQDRNVLVHWEAIPGTSLQEMDRVTSMATQDLRKLSGVQDVGAHVGRATNSDEPVDVNTADMWVSLAGSADYATTLAAVQSVVHGFPGLKATVENYDQSRVEAVSADANSGADLTVRVYGTDLDTMNGTAQKVAQQIASVGGLVQPRVVAPPEKPTLQVEADLNAVQKYGLVPGDIRRAASTYFAGTLVGNLYQDQRIFDVVVWGAPETRRTPQDLTNLVIDTPSGGQVKLGDVATVKIVPFPEVLKHYGTSRYVDVDARVSGRDIKAVMSDVQSRVQSMPMPTEYHAEVLSDLSTSQGQDRTMLLLAAGVAVVILLLFQAAFGSWRLAALALGLIPPALVGGLVGNVIAGGDMSLSALLGLFLVLGLSARTTVLLVSSYLRAEEAGSAADRTALVLGATRDRLGSILLTAAATFAVFVPIAFAGNRPGTEVLNPMAAVVLGGVITSTLLTLTVLPTLYLRISSAVTLTGRAPRRRGRGGAAERSLTSSGVGGA